MQPHQDDLNHALIKAAQQGSLPDLERALAAGANPNATDSDGRNALMTALLAERARNDSRAPNQPHRACAERLLPLSDPSHTDHQGETALMIATPFAIPATLRAIAELSDSNARRLDGLTALMIAVAVTVGQRSWPVKLLLDYSDPNARNHQGETALHLAARHDNFVAAVTLLERCDANLTNQDGNTALMIALKQPYAQVAAALLAKSNIMLANREGETALSLARRARSLSFEEGNFFPRETQSLFEAITAEYERQTMEQTLPRPSARARPGL